MKTAVRIPYVDLARQHASLKSELLEAAARVIDSGRFVLGPAVEEFEKAFCRAFGYKHAVGVNSGTDALVIALKVLGLKPGDEVITAANSFITTAGAIIQAGARPVFADVRDDYNLDPAAVEKAVTSRTRAVLPVHLTGRPCDMKALAAVAQKHNLVMVEDCAQAAGAASHGRPVGTFGPLGCYSLHPLKTLSALGDAGLIVTADEALARKCRQFRNGGLSSRDKSPEWGYNSRLDSLQAAFLSVKLKRFAEWTAKRRANARFYRENLAGLKGLGVPQDRPGEESVYHLFMIQADDRDGLKDHLEKKGIGSGIHYPIPIHLQEAARDLGYRPGDLPVTERLAGRILSLPVYPELTQADLKNIVQAIRGFVKK